MLQRMLLALGLVCMLTSCATLSKPDEAYRLYHPGIGATAMCGHWVWWECAVWNYRRHGYKPAPEPFRDTYQGAL
jgi:hypothetical protein